MEGDSSSNSKERREKVCRNCEYLGIPSGQYPCICCTHLLSEYFGVGADSADYFKEGEECGNE
ncbi:hypothetical protein [Clostridium felsineum]|uniref:hypothetical protein n=1 Tax=Clostridium felsineum TaxID=36839 RepID=UPI00098CB4DB|nr:hypothetical protein [Clostridium felsineum]URZ16892.1 hypothetical protein CLFE_029390 [Clostridium felsineum DSM 794]